MNILYVYYSFLDFLNVDAVWSSFVLETLQDAAGTFKFKQALRSKAGNPLITTLKSRIPLKVPELDTPWVQ